MEGRRCGARRAMVTARAVERLIPAWGMRRAAGREAARHAVERAEQQLQSQIMADRCRLRDVIIPEFLRRAAPDRMTSPAVSSFAASSGEFRR